MQTIKALGFPLPFRLGDSKKRENLHLLDDIKSLVTISSIIKSRRSL